MNRKEAKELMPIIQAFAEGKVIESRTKPSTVKGKYIPNDWTEIKEIGYWDNIEYRVKPEPKYRPFKDAEECWKEMLGYALEHSPYKVGEKVAIAQRYIDLVNNDEFYRLCGIHGMPLEYIRFEKGCDNKMFVKADLMPYHIYITNVRIERLQDISEEDCLAEGIVDFESKINKAHFYSITEKSATYSTPREPFAQLIDKLSGKGTWASNPFVFVYEFYIYIYNE